MAQLKITTKDRKAIKVNGNVTFEAELIEVNEEERIQITGKMMTHKYIEEIEKIETHRYILTGIEVWRETFGSDDFNILYEFVANDYIVKNGLTNLGNDLIEEIEASIYEDSTSNLWEGDDE